MSRKTPWLSWGIIILVSIFLGSAAGAAGPVELRGAAVGNINHPQAQAGDIFAKLIEQKSGGQIKAKWYHSGQIGAEADILSQLNNDTLQFATVSNALSGTLNPKPMTMYTPFLIRDWDTLLNKWIGSEGARLILDSLKPNGLVGLGWVPYGFNVLAYTDPPIRTLEECKGRKIRAAQSYTIKGTLEALGMNAPPIPWTEVFTSIQQKVVEGCTAPAGILSANRFHEVIKNITIADHLFGTHAFWFREKALQKFPSDQQKLIVETVKEACAEQQKRMRDYDDKAVEELKAKGVKVWTLTPEEKARWIKASRVVFLEHEKKIDDKSKDGRAFLTAVFKSLGRDYEKEILNP
jgi:TRAP-type C4-dicarboxylate transport system substrate-binding protein